ncbi:retrovirus-related pol polyprotein from transposon TNT 1-94 [Tanacetum coccineum]
MANLSEDIQCAGSDTRPPMLDKADFASWQQRIRLYCRGKDNGVNILKSIDEGPFQMGTMRVTVAEGTEGPLNLGPERPRVYSDLSQDEKDRYNADIRATNIILQGLPKDIYSLINHYTDAKDIWDNVKMLLEGSELTKEDRESQLVILFSIHNDEWKSFQCHHQTALRLRFEEISLRFEEDYTSDSHMTPYDQYVKDNAVPVVQNIASMVPNDAYVMIDNDLHESDICGRPLYFDTSLTGPRVLDAMLSYFVSQYGSPQSRTHLYGWEYDEAVEVARAQVAKLINASAI